jgi:hypothetical protein
LWRNTREEEGKQQEDQNAILKEKLSVLKGCSNVPRTKSKFDSFCKNHIAVKDQDILNNLWTDFNAMRSTKKSTRTLLEQSKNEVDEMPKAQAKRCDNSLGEYLTKLKSYGNVPTKREKFDNFCKNSLNVQEQETLDILWKAVTGTNPKNKETFAGCSKDSTDAQDIEEKSLSPPLKMSTANNRRKSTQTEGSKQKPVSTQPIADEKETTPSTQASLQPIPTESTKDTGDIHPPHASNSSEKMELIHSKPGVKKRPGKTLKVEVNHCQVDIQNVVN